MVYGDAATVCRAPDGRHWDADVRCAPADPLTKPNSDSHSRDSVVNILVVFALFALLTLASLVGLTADSRDSADWKPSQGGRRVPD